MQLQVTNSISYIGIRTLPRYFRYIKIVVLLIAWLSSRPIDKKVRVLSILPRVFNILHYAGSMFSKFNLGNNPSWFTNGLLYNTVFKDDKFSEATN